jgi:hypothetical protein
MCTGAKAPGQKKKNKLWPNERLPCPEDAGVAGDAFLLLPLSTFPSSASACLWQMPLAFAVLRLSLAPAFGSLPSAACLWQLPLLRPHPQLPLEEREERGDAIPFPFLSFSLSFGTKASFEDLWKESLRDPSPRGTLRGVSTSSLCPVAERCFVFSLQVESGLRSSSQKGKKASEIPSTPSPLEWFEFSLVLSLDCETIFPQVLRGVSTSSLCPVAEIASSHFSRPSMPRLPLREAGREVLRSHAPLGNPLRSLSGPEPFLRDPSPRGTLRGPSPLLCPETSTSLIRGGCLWRKDLRMLYP